MKAAIYTRVSTKDKGQTTENQRIVLENYCKSQGVEVVQVYEDHESGGSANRPAFKQMFADASKGRFQLVLFWSLDRFSREGTRQTIHYLEQLESYGVAFKSYSEQYIDATGIFKDVVISLLSTLARQEKVRLSERVKAGLARTDKKGGRPSVPVQIIKQIQDFKKQGWSNRRIGEALQISHVTVGTYLASA